MESITKMKRSEFEVAGVMFLTKSGKGARLEVGGHVYYMSRESALAVLRGERKNVTVSKLKPTFRNLSGESHPS